MGPSPQALARRCLCGMSLSLATPVQRGSPHTNTLRGGCHTAPASVTPSESPPGLWTYQREPAAPAFPKSVSSRTRSDVRPKHHGCVSGKPASPGHGGRLRVTHARAQQGPMRSARTASQLLADGAVPRLSPAVAGNVRPFCTPQSWCYGSGIRRGFVIAGGILSCHSKLGYREK